MPEPTVVNTAAPVQTQTDFQKWSKLPEDARNGDQEASSATEPAEAAAAAKPAPDSDPVVNDQETKDAAKAAAREAQAKEDAEVPKGLQKRFRELTTKIRNLEAAAATRVATEPAKADPIAKPQPAADAAGRPESKDFDTYDEYILKLQDWNLDQRDQKKQRETAQQTEARADAERGREWQTELAAARERYEDYDDVALTEMPINRATHNAIVEGGRDGAELAYYLGQHRDEAAEIFKLSPVRTTLALGKIIADFEKPDSPADSRSAKPAVSRAPRPPKPVGSGSTDSAGKEPDPSDYPKWSRWNAKREAAEAAD
jgi:hypothetical protein